MPLAGLHLQGESETRARFMVAASHTPAADNEERAEISYFPLLCDCRGAGAPHAEFNPAVSSSGRCLFLPKL
jgi:hypothetical protein